jgi:hypothetical protein
MNMGKLKFKLNDLNEEIDETFERWEREFKKKHPIKQWINDLFGGILFGYAPHYSLSHPHVLFMDTMRQIKWAYQRVYRGWDDRASWSINYWLDGMMPSILMRLKETSHGIPIKFFEGLPHDENYNYGDDGDKVARELWNKELDKIIAGFVCSKKIDDWKYETDEEGEVLQKVFENGMKSFIEHYHSLWY